MHPIIAFLPTEQSSDGLACDDRKQSLRRKDKKEKAKKSLTAVHADGTKFGDQVI